MNANIVSFKDVTKYYPMYHHITRGFKHFVLNFPKGLMSRSERFEAIRRFSLDVQKGETLGIIGRNGAGKSTLLGLIAGVLRPNGGAVSVSGRVSPFLELGAGIHPELSGIENIYLNGVLLGMTRKEVTAKIDRIVEFAELEEFVDQPVRTYSTGMLAKLGFSVVAHLEPEILLIDEVLAVGDILFQKKCIGTILDFKKQGVTIIFVSHAMEDVRRICDRVAWIENHTVRMIGDTDEVVGAYLEYYLDEAQEAVISE